MQVHVEQKFVPGPVFVLHVLAYAYVLISLSDLFKYTNYFRLDPKTDSAFCYLDDATVCMDSKLSVGTRRNYS